MPENPFHLWARIRRAARLLRRERGQTTLMVAIAFPLLITFTAFAVDTANWWVHKRHLQAQADAAALAGAHAIAFPCVQGTVEAATRLYSGDRTGDYNQQIGPTT